jgi:PAS domain S-box-containing protein
MKRRSDPPQDWDTLREKIIGLGERSVRKSYYPELQQRYADLQRFRQLLDQSSELIVAFDVGSLEILDANETAREMLDRVGEPCPGGRLARLHAAIAEAALEAIDRPGEPKPLRADCPGPGGTVFAADGWAKVVTVGGRPTGMVVAHDVSPRIRAETGWRESEAKYRRLYATMRDAFVSVDMDGNIQEFNTAFETMLGYSGDELRQLTYRDLTPEKWHAFEADIVEKQILKRGYSGVYEKEYRRKDGSLFPIDLRTILIRDSAGDPAGMWAIVRDISERKRAENAMQALLRGTTTVGEGFFAALVRELAAALQARCVYVGERLPGGAKGRTVAVWLDGKPVDNFDCDLAHCVCASVPGKSLFNVPRGGGGRERFPQDRLLAELVAETCLVMPMFGSDGGPLGFLVVIHDRPLADPEIATALLPIFGARAAAELERIRADAALRRSAEDLRVTLRSIGDAVIATDEQERIVLMNPVAETLSGWREQDARQRPLRDVFRIVDEETGATVESPASQVLREGHAVGLADQTLLIARDGTQHPVADSGAPIRLPGDEAVRGVVLVFRDQTEERRHLDALARSELRFRTLFEQAAVGVAQIDADSECFMRVNQRYAQLLGYRPEDMVGLSFESVVHPKDLAQHWEHLKGLADGRANGFCAEQRCLRKDGETVWVALSVSTLSAPEGGERALVAVAEDISARKQAEEAIRQLQDDLERRVDQRTADLASAMRELEAFSYTVSHDLRAPLRAINGYSRLIMEEEGHHLGAESRRLLDRVIASTIRMEQLIDDILEYSRAGRQPMFAKMVDLKALVTDLVAELSDAYPEAQITVGNLPAVSGDPIMLRQIFANLVGNALKFTSRQSHPRVEVGATYEEEKPVLFVQDNGIGFDMRYAGKLFGMFQRMHADAQFPGTGVGLALVKRLVERHRGRVWAESESGKGAKFCFSLDGGSLDLDGRETGAAAVQPPKP